MLPANTSCSGVAAGGVIIDGGVSIGNRLSSTDRAITVHKGAISICNGDNASSGVTGSVFTAGGVGISKDLYVGTESILVGEVTVNTGIVPDADEGAYLGSTAKPFSEAHIGEVRIGPGTNDGEIDTATGNLRLDSAGGTVEVDDNLTVTGTNLTTLGAASNPIATVVAKVNGSMEVTGDITAFASSDLTLKQNVNPIMDALQKVNLISGNTFDWNNTSPREGSETGVIAQEIEALGLPGVVKLREDNTYGVRYERLVPLLIEAIKELSNKVDALS